MNGLRNIRKEEINLIEFLLYKAGLTDKNLVISELVDDYEGGKMGSIGLGLPDSIYESDIIQAEYTDSDQVPVVITLTQDTNQKILDLDFWKTDFSKLLVYPKPENLQFKTSNLFSLEN